MFFYAHLHTALRQRPNRAHREGDVAEEPHQQMRAKRSLKEGKSFSLRKSIYMTVLLVRAGLLTLDRRLLLLCTMAAAAVFDAIDSDGNGYISKMGAFPFSLCVSVARAKSLSFLQWSVSCVLVWSLDGAIAPPPVILSTYARTPSARHAAAIQHGCVQCVPQLM